MKKIIAAVLCAALAFTLCGASFAEPGAAPDSVAGLDERLDMLFIRNNFTEEEINTMNQEYIDWFTERFWMWDASRFESNGYNENR